MSAFCFSFFFSKYFLTCHILPHSVAKKWSSGKNVQVRRRNCVRLNRDSIFSFVLQFFQFFLLKRIRNFSFKYQIPLKLSYTLFMVSNTFVSNTSLKFSKLQATSKQLLEAELLLFENSLVSSTRYHPKIGHILNKV